jgi:hypothetical protein
MTADIGRYVLALSGAVTLAGCSLPASLVTTPRNPQILKSFAASYVPAGRDAGASWILPEATSQDLLYISDAKTVSIYGYPQGNLVGILKRFYLPAGMCVDKSGDVFIVDTGYAKIFEYAHGGKKRLSTLASPTRDPVGCAVDPVTGNLAVGSEGFGSSPTVAVFKSARGKPTTYEDSAFYQFYFCGYDDGDLFIDGITAPGSGHFGVAELGKGRSSLHNVTVDEYVTFPGGVQWDGKYLAIGDQLNNVYEFAISGYQGKAVGTTRFESGARYVKQFWIQNDVIIAPNVYKKHARSNVLLFDYPTGGKAFMKITDGVSDAQGAVVSLAPK